MIEMSVRMFIFQARTSLGSRRFERAITNGAELLAVHHLKHPAVQLRRNWVAADLVVKPWMQNVLHLINLIRSERANMTLFGGSFRFGVGAEGSGRFFLSSMGDARSRKTRLNSISRG